MILESYKKYCAVCKKETKQVIVREHIRRGAKCRCLSCGVTDIKYMNHKLLLKRRLKDEQ